MREMSEPVAFRRLRRHTGGRVSLSLFKFTWRSSTGPSMISRTQSDRKGCQERYRRLVLASDNDWLEENHTHDDVSS